MLTGVINHETPFKNVLYKNKIYMNSWKNVENLAKVMIEVEKMILPSLDKNALNQYFAQNLISLPLALYIFHQISLYQ